MFGFSRTYSISCVHSMPQHQAVTSSDSIRLKQVINNNYPSEDTQERKVIVLVDNKQLEKVA